MSTSYATAELRDLMTKPSGLPGPDRRTLIYAVRCPLTNDACRLEACETGACDAAADDDYEPEIHVSAVPHYSQPHPLPSIDTTAEWQEAVSEAATMLDYDQLQKLDEAQLRMTHDAAEKSARSALVKIARTSVDQVYEHNPSLRACECCGKRSLSDTPDCPGCRRLADPDANHVRHY